MSKRRIYREKMSGQFTNRAAEDENPAAVTIETISPTADLIALVRDFTESGDIERDEVRRYQVTMANVLQGINGV